MSKKAWVMFDKYQLEMQKTDQDQFGMHIFNDWTGYGAQEVIENIV